MATVYLAEQMDLGRQVALKELSSFHARDASVASRFLREAQLSGSLTHPNIVTVHEYLVEGAIPYIAMEYCPRGSLRSRVHSVTLAQAAGVVEGVLAALAVAESRGIVHRDLKPENLMITTDGSIKITDFGIAKALDSAATPNLTLTGSTVGTPHYMAPEQAMGTEVGPYTDLYSLGIVAFEMLTGRVPYADTATPMAVLLRQVNEPIESLVMARPDLDEPVCRWVDAMVAKDPAERPPNAAVAWEQFEDAILTILGPRWRRQARLLGSTAELSTAKPLTPAPFASLGGQTLDGPTPAGEPAPPGGTQTPQHLQPLDTIAPPVGSEPTRVDARTGDPASQPHADRAPTPDAVEPLARGRDASGAEDTIKPATSTTTTARRLRVLGACLLVAALVASVVVVVALVGGSRGSTTAGAHRPAGVGLHAIPGRAVPIGTRRVVLTAFDDQPWLLTRGEANGPGTVSPVDDAGHPGTSIALTGIPTGIGAGAGALWILEVSGYQNPTVFVERVTPDTGVRTRVRTLTSAAQLPCVTNGAITCNPVVKGKTLWLPVDSALFGLPIRGRAETTKIQLPEPVWDLISYDGQLWAISGKSLLRIDAKGAVHSVLGPNRFPSGLQPNHLAAAAGRIWVSAMSPPGRPETAGRMVIVPAHGSGAPIILRYPYAGSIAARGDAIWVESYHGEDRLRALSATTGAELGSEATVGNDIAWLAPVRGGLMASTFDADSSARTIIPLRVTR
jgi:hypothetical protein